MKIVVTRNRYSNENWPRVVWVDADAPLPDFDFFVYCAEHVELMYHPDQLVKFRETELCGVIQESESLHYFLSAHPAPLGYPRWRDDFFVLKAGDYAEKFLKLWRQSAGGVGAVSDTVWTLGVPPVQYPGVIKLHPAEDAEPVIQWGLR